VVDQPLHWSRRTHVFSPESVELLLKGVGLNNIGSPPREPVEETKVALKVPQGKTLCNKTIMDKFLEDTNQGTPSQGDSCAFPFFGNIGAPLMATLNIPGLTVGLLVWLWTTLNVPNALEASQISTLCQGNQIDVDPLPSSSVKYTPPPSASSSESLATSNQKSKRNRKRKNKKKKQRQRENSPTTASHVGDMQPTTASHVGERKPL
jgi:hypothetical protein